MRVLLLWLLAPWVMATPADRLAERLLAIQTLQADFNQLARDGAGRDVQSVPGEMALERPNLLNWVTQDPIPQRIVSDGQALWTYDIDLEQVTRDPVTVLDDSPAALLLRLDAQDLRERFAVTQDLSSSTLTRFQLIPNAEDSLYQILVLEFAGDIPVTLGVVDSLDQQTRISLTNVRVNQPIAAGQFEFELTQDMDFLDNLP